MEKQFIKQYTNFDEFKKNHLDFVNRHDLGDLSDLVSLIYNYADEEIEYIDYIELILSESDYKYFIKYEEDESIDTVFTYNIGKEVDLYKNLKQEKTKIREQKWKDFLFNNSKEEIFEKLKSINFPF